MVNRKRPTRDDWKNYGSEGNHEGDGPFQDVDQDICIKVRETVRETNEPPDWAAGEVDMSWDTQDLL